MPELTINGELRVFQAEEFPQTLMGLLVVLDIVPATIVAEHNEEIVPRDNFESEALSSGDKLELVQFVGGG